MATPEHSWLRHQLQPEPQPGLHDPPLCGLLHDHRAAAARYDVDDGRLHQSLLSKPTCPPGVDQATNRNRGIAVRNLLRLDQSLGCVSQSTRRPTACSSPTNRPTPGRREIGEKSERSTIIYWPNEISARQSVLRSPTFVAKPQVAPPQMCDEPRWGTFPSGTYLTDRIRTRRERGRPAVSRGLLVISRG